MPINEKYALPLLLIIRRDHRASCTGSLHGKGYYLQANSGETLFEILCTNYLMRCCVGGNYVVEWIFHSIDAIIISSDGGIEGVVDS